MGTETLSPRSSQPLLRTLLEELPDTWTVDDTAGSPWLRAAPPAAHLPEQGWKVHVSATGPGAEKTLRQALPVLVSREVTFKLARSLEMLEILNAGGGGFSQIGKFITAYPATDSEAVDLAVALDAALVGLCGPIVPSDRILSPDSVVFYRYGAFHTPMLQTARGVLTSALRSPDGSWGEDRRGVTPAWVTDPFLAAGVTTDHPQETPLVGRRYLVLHTLNVSPRGAVYLGADIECGDSVVVKRAFRQAAIDHLGRDAQERLRNEERMLTRLRGIRGIPEARELITHNGDLYLGIQDVRGVSLEDRIIEAIRRCDRPSIDEVLTWAAGLSEVLGEVHAAGVVYRDVKPSNILVTKSEGMWLVDLEDAVVKADVRTAGARGTRGYVAPEQAAGAPPDERADVYSFGALLYHLLTCADPSLAPDPLNLLTRPIELLNPDVPPWLCGVVARCLSQAPDCRPASMTEIASLLRRPVPVPAPQRLTMPIRSDVEEGVMVRKRARELAVRLGDSLTRAATVDDALRAHWVSSHPTSFGLAARDINLGNAGSLLALSELAECTRSPDHLSLLRRGAKWLSSAPRNAGTPLPGLYVGEAGIALALLRAGLVLSDDGLVARAVAQAAEIATMPHTAPDLFSGTAGRLRFHLIVANAAPDSRHLQAAIAAGNVLLSNAVRCGSGAFWEMPSGYGNLSGKALTGFAHGAAGIGDSLLDLYERTSDERYLDLALDAARWLVPQTVVVPRVDGLNWPDVPGESLAHAAWCHGAAGIGQFMLRAAGFDATFFDSAVGAARTIAGTERHMNPTRCHGLAGNIDLLIDLYQATQEKRYLREVDVLFRLLKVFCVEGEHGAVCPSELPSIVTPDYMLGYAGVLGSLLRIADPERRANLLSLGGFYPEEVALAKGEEKQAGAAEFS